MVGYTANAVFTAGSSQLGNAILLLRVRSSLAALGPYKYKPIIIGLCMPVLRGTRSPLKVIRGSIILSPRTTIYHSK